MSQKFSIWPGGSNRRAHSNMGLFRSIHQMKAVRLIALVLGATALVAVVVVVVNGLYSAWALLELAWSAVLRLANLF